MTCSLSSPRLGIASSREASAEARRGCTYTLNHYIPILQDNHGVHGWPSSNVNYVISYIVKLDEFMVFRLL